MTDRFADQMKREAGELGIALNGGQLEQFFRYYELLVERNKVMNLHRDHRGAGCGDKTFYRQPFPGEADGNGGACGKTLMDVGNRGRFSGDSVKDCVPGAESDVVGFPE